jgi:hypothetical protein
MVLVLHEVIQRKGKKNDRSSYRKFGVNDKIA